MVQHVAGPLVLRPRYPWLGVFFHETDVTIVFWQAKHHRRATKFRSCLSLSHFSHIKVWCSQSKFHCHFSNVEKKTWRLAYFTPVVLPLELVLALANSRRSDDRAEGRFWTAILSDCSTVWSVMWLLHSDFVCWPTVILVPDTYPVLLDSYWKPAPGTLKTQIPSHILPYSSCGCDCLTLLDC